MKRLEDLAAELLIEHDPRGAQNSGVQETLLVGTDNGSYTIAMGSRKLEKISDMRACCWLPSGEGFVVVNNSGVTPELMRVRFDGESKVFYRHVLPRADPVMKMSAQGVLIAELYGKPKTLNAFFPEGRHRVIYTGDFNLIDLYDDLVLLTVPSPSLTRLNDIKIIDTTGSNVNTITGVDPLFFISREYFIAAKTIGKYLVNALSGEKERIHVGFLKGMGPEGDSDAIALHYARTQFNAFGEGTAVLCYVDSKSGSVLWQAHMDKIGEDIPPFPHIRLSASGKYIAVIDYEAKNKPSTIFVITEERERVGQWKIPEQARFYEWSPLVIGA